MGKSTTVIDQLFDLNQESKKIIFQEQAAFSYLSSEAEIKGISWYLPEPEGERKIQLFNRLKSYFEIGFFLTQDKNHHQTWHLEQGFILHRLISASDFKKRNIELPHFNTFKVYKSKNTKILKNLGLDLLEDNHYTTIIYKIDSNTIFCFLTKQANPWLGLRLELILKEIHNGLV